VDKSFVDKSFVDKSFVDRVSWTGQSFVDRRDCHFHDTPVRGSNPVTGYLFTCSHVLPAWLCNGEIKGH